MTPQDFIRTAILALIAGTSAAQTTPSTPRYTISATITMPSADEFFTASDLADDGTVVGFIGVNSTGRTYAARWKSGVFTSLPPAATTFNSAIAAINALGQTAGAAQASVGGAFSAYRNDNLEVRSLAEFGWGSAARDINDTGYVVGETATGPFANSRRGFVFDGRQTHVLGIFGGNGISIATAVNNSGVVVGSASNASNSMSAFKFERGTMIDLGCLDSARCEATGINDLGDIVGTVSGYYTSSVIWRDGGLNVLPLPPSSLCAWPSAINNRREVVGTAVNCIIPAPSIGWVFTAGQVIELGALLSESERASWTFSSALKINNSGQILAAGTPTSNRNGYTYLILSPVVSPTLTPETEPNNTRSRAQRLPVLPVQVAGRMDVEGDTDFYRVTLPAGQTLSARLQPAAGSDANLLLMDTAGLTLARSTRGAGLEDRASWRNAGTAPADLFVRVRWASGGVGPGAGNYLLGLGAGTP